jgi:hypothetical protein
MIERRGGLRLALEAAALDGIGEIIGQEFDRDRPIEFGIEPAIDRPHPARTERRPDHVHADLYSRESGLGHDLRQYQTFSAVAQGNGDASQAAASSSHDRASGIVAAMIEDNQFPVNRYFRWNR